MRGIRFPHLQSFGLNPLTIYIVQQVLIAFYGSYLPKEAPLWQAFAGFAVVYGICYAVARHLRRQGIVIKI
jgi:hypothetical protein